MKKYGCFTIALDCLLLVDALLSVISGLGTIYDYTVIVVSISFLLPLIICKLGEELKIRKKLKEIQDARKAEHKDS